MKCEIIQDLLPLYVEELCSAASVEEVEKHLETCEKCRQECEKMKEEVSAVSKTPALENYQAEKELLEKSRTAIERSMKEKLLEKLFAVLFALSMICNLAAVPVLIWAYEFRYPKLHFKYGGFQIWPILLMLFPTVLIFFNMRERKKERRVKWISKVLKVSVIPAALIGMVSMLILAVLPPVCSETKNPEHYMKLDKLGTQTNILLDNFFPDKIPEDAEKVCYHYQKTSTLLADEIQVEASWILPEETYRAVKQSVSALKYFQNSQATESNGAGIILGEAGVKDSSIRFSYDDAERRVGYFAELDVSQ